MKDCASQMPLSPGHAADPRRHRALHREEQRTKPGGVRGSCYGSVENFACLMQFLRERRRYPLFKLGHISELAP